MAEKYDSFLFCIFLWEINYSIHFFPWITLISLKNSILLNIIILYLLLGHLKYHFIGYVKFMLNFFRFYFVFYRPFFFFKQIFFRFGCIKKSSFVSALFPYLCIVRLSFNIPIIISFFLNNLWAAATTTPGFFFSSIHPYTNTT